MLGWYFILPPTPAGTLVFAAVMGFLWLGVGPLVAGSVAEMFGLRWQAMIQGLAFMSHQIGSFVGAFGGGVLFDALGSYDLAWRLAVVDGADRRHPPGGLRAVAAAAGGRRRHRRDALYSARFSTEPCRCRSARSCSAGRPIRS